MFSSTHVYEQINILSIAAPVMSWNDLYWSSRNDTDMRTMQGAGSSGTGRSTEITGYQHLFGRVQEAAEQRARGVGGLHADAVRVWYLFLLKC